jgi:predicted GNAT family acetyltransferase
MPHPLDHPVWSALSTRQRPLAQGDHRALRLASDYGWFAASADKSPENLSALATLPIDEVGLFLVEAAPTPQPAGMVVVSEAACRQMVADAVEAVENPFDIVPLGDADAAEMLDLALLTKPGPFSTATHRLGEFIGVREGGKLVAMADERMKPDGFAEVSGVCTHPDHRGHGYARVLSSIVGRRIVARGEIPFLHAFETNTGAMRLYEQLGFRDRSGITLTLLRRA